MREREGVHIDGNARFANDANSFSKIIFCVFNKICFFALNIFLGNYCIAVRNVRDLYANLQVLCVCECVRVLRVSARVSASVKRARKVYLMDANAMLS